MIERLVRKVKEGNSCALEQSGFSSPWWSDAQNWFLFLSSVIDVVKDKLTAYQLRFGVQYLGPLVPFGAYCEYKPASKKEEELVPVYCRKLLESLLIGYEERSGCAWSGNVLFVPLYRLETAATSGCLDLRVISAKESISRQEIMVITSFLWLKVYGNNQTIQNLPETRKKPGFYLVQTNHAHPLGTCANP